MPSCGATDIATCSLRSIRPDENEPRQFGHHPSRSRPDWVPVEDPYYGYPKGKAGRPRKADKLSNAEKQRRYRERVKSRQK
jgi:hypothetical protein